MTKATKPKFSTYQMITDNVIGLIENAIDSGDVIPWRKPWAGGLRPQNPITGTIYKGINAVILNCYSYSRTLPLWFTMNNAKKLGARIALEEMKKSIPICFYKTFESKTETEIRNGVEVPKKIFMLRYYRVWNIDQLEDCEKLQKIRDKFAVKTIDFEPIEKAQKIVENYKDCPSIRTGGNASYSPSQDIITVPAQKSFITSEDYYSTLYHEMVHSTGHGSRLNRDSITKADSFGSEQYSKEELVAEMGATILANEACIAQDLYDNSVAYMRSWVKKLKDNPKWLIQSATQAEKASHYILTGEKVYKRDK